MYFKSFLKSSNKKQHNPIANTLWINYTYSKDYLSRTEKNVFSNTRKFQLNFDVTKWDIVKVIKTRDFKEKEFTYSVNIELRLATISVWFSKYKYIRIEDAQYSWNTHNLTVFLPCQKSLKTFPIHKPIFASNRCDTPNEWERQKESALALNSICDAPWTRWQHSLFCILPFFITPLSLDNIQDLTTVGTFVLLCPGFSTGLRYHYSTKLKLCLEMNSPQAAEHKS